MADKGRWGGYFGAVLRGIVRGVPFAGDIAAECMLVAEGRRNQQRVEDLLHQVGRGDAGATQALRSLSEDEVEEAVAEAVPKLSQPDRDKLAAEMTGLSSSAPDRVDGVFEKALTILSGSAEVRHTLLARAAGVQGILAPGTKLADRYEILELVGVGGMACVYRARDHVLDEDVAVKILRVELAKDPAIQRRFVQEAKVCLSLAHDGIVRVRDIQRVDDVPCLTMEWVEGPTMRACLQQRGKLAWDEAAPVIRGLLGALAYAHSKGVLHLDLKPENILLPQIDTPKLCDFGLARVMESPGGASQLSGSGTPYYIPPEQRLGQELDARADVYAAGVVLYELLAGRLPGRRTPTLHEGFGVDEGISRAVESAIDEDRAQRPADAGVLYEAIFAVPPSAGTTVRRTRGTEGPIVRGLSFLSVNEQGHREYQNEEDGSVLIYVAPVEFVMGLDGAGPHEGPAHRVALDGHFLGKYEVTNAQYRAFCAATGHAEPSTAADLYFRDARYDRHPVVGVSWGDAKAYCDWAGLRLPTEAEWECAAGWDMAAGRARKYPWGDDEPTDRVVRVIHSGETPEEVGACPGGASPCGATDMAGNVCEWCADWYDESYYASFHGLVRNPSGPTTGTSRVVRGWSWDGDTRGLRVTARHAYGPQNRNRVFGLRVARGLD